MGEQGKFKTERLFRNVISMVKKNVHEDGVEDLTLDLMPNLKEVLNGMASWAGKGKDELVQVLCREIGVATAAVLKQPLLQVVENQKLVVTVELARKKKKKPKHSTAKSGTSKHRQKE